MPNRTRALAARTLAGLTIVALIACAPDRPEHVTTTSTSSPQHISLSAMPTPWKVNDAVRWIEAARPAPPVPRTARTMRARRTDAEIEACIIARENGGDYGRSSNPNHFGRYQYDRQTWVANGGDPDTWGSASPEEQDRVFRDTVNAHGYGAWTPYNGCG